MQGSLLCKFYKFNFSLHIICTINTSVSDPDPYVLGPPGSGLLVRGMDPDPAMIRILISSSKNSKKNLDSYCSVTFFMIVYL
jgi:hypothetical protein